MPDNTQPDPSEQSRLAAPIARYLAERYGWQSAQYRLAFRAVSADMRSVTVWAEFLEDARYPTPGGGRSRELQVERASGSVLRDLRFQ